MRRFHALEWEDLKWFPTSWRDFGTDYLKFIATKFDIYKPILPLIRKAMEKSEQNHWVDLASGGGSALVQLAKVLKAENPELKITLTDYYPNIRAFELLQKEFPTIFSFEKTSINAMQPPKHLEGTLKTIFGAFHHFRPKDAKQVLQDTIDSNSTIAVFEPVGRNIGSWFSMLFVPLNVFVFTLFIRPVRLKVLPFIYLLPLVPLYILWDGIASILRTYSEKELKALVSSLNNTESYHWEIGKTKGAMPIRYLIGYKK
ncbi:MAG: hypothetical protein M9916_09635 [Crocinitomicaceae bacterium]|nr:hypothetical protein [Crocinitomicaceae bacterium]